MLNINVIRKQILPTKIIHSYYPQFIAVILFFCASIIQLHLGNQWILADAGYLWYDVQLTMHGMLPILRDAASYDPGRYYWCAGIMELLRSQGIIALRIAIDLFAAIGILFAVTLVTRNKNNIIYSLLVSMIFIMWMHPHHKLFDITACIVIILLLTQLLDKPSPKRCFILGVGIGCIAIIGRNHGVYGAIGSLLALVYLATANKKLRFTQGLIWWSAGVIVGYSPILLAMTFIPGFGYQFIHNILFPFRVGATNLPLPIPWPWHISMTHITYTGILRKILVGLIFIALPLFGLIGYVYAFWCMRSKNKIKPLSPVILASVIMAIPYSHFAYSRADISHLAQSIFPLLIGICVIANHFRHQIRDMLIFTLCVVSIFIMAPKHIAYQYWTHNDWKSVAVGQDQLIVNPRTATVILLLDHLVRHFAPDNEPFLALPYMPGAYAIFNRQAPIHGVYCLFKRSQSFQEAEIARIRDAHPKFILIQSHPIDENADTGFSHTNPLIYRYIEAHFIVSFYPQANNLGLQLMLPISTSHN